MKRQFNSIGGHTLEAPKRLRRRKGIAPGVHSILGHPLPTLDSFVLPIMEGEDNSTINSLLVRLQNKPKPKKGGADDGGKPENDRK
jgi:hypothetical protein